MRDFVYSVVAVGKNDNRESDIDGDYSTLEELREYVKKRYKCSEDDVLIDPYRQSLYLRLGMTEVKLAEIEKIKSSW